MSGRAQRSRPRDAPPTPSLSNLSRTGTRATRAIAFVDVGVKDELGRILVVQAQNNNEWMLPGGRLEEHEIHQPWLGAKRELKKKSGYNIHHLGQQNLVSSAGGCHLYSTVFKFGEVDRRHIFNTRSREADVIDFGFVHREGYNFVVTTYGGKSKSSWALRRGQRDHLEELFKLSTPPPSLAGGSSIPHQSKGKGRGGGLSHGGRGGRTR